ncbi:MAG: hypothetical protein AMXMBFR84_39030 [Candidatus Hydrogenedentota bacterium]
MRKFGGIAKRLVRSCIQNTNGAGRGGVLLLRIGLLAGLVCMTKPGWTAGELEKSALELDGSGWIDVMPGADLKGWSRVPVPPGDPLGKQQWHVDSAGTTLICDGDGGHDMLLCDREFGDAIHHFEFRYTKVDGASGYNSGIYVRNNADGSVWHQAQFGDGNGGYLFGGTLDSEGKKKSFSLSDQVTDGRVKPAGEWNTMEITARGSTLTLWINGAVTCEFTECGNPKGLMGVEGEGYRIEFRKLMVKELP